MSTTTATSGSAADRLAVGDAAARFTHLTRWLWSAVLAVAVVAGGLFAWNRQEQAGAIEYVTQPVERGALHITVTATGNLAPTNQVEVGSELSGIVKRVAVDYDQRVTTGQILAQLDTTKLEAQIRQAEAALEAARARVRQVEATEQEAQAALARAERLAADQLVSPSDLDATRATHARAVADHASATAAVRQTEATIQASRTDLGKMTIRSPITGVVLSRAIERGQTVAASFQAPVLFTLAEDLTKMELDVDVDEADVGQVSAGEAATFTVDAYPDRTFTARVAAVRLGSQKTEGVVTYKTVLYVDNTALLLRPGMTATADITVRQAADVLLVPNAALRFAPSAAQTRTAAGGQSLVTRLLPRRPGGARTAPQSASPAGRHQRVWVLRDGRPTAVSITVGSSDGRVSEVTGGDLEPGMPLIVATGTPGS